LRFVGCALAWRPGEAREKVSCLVVLDERGSIIANSFAASAEDIAGAVEGYGAERRGIVVGVDAPLAVPNERGTRRIERILSKVALPAYSASRRMFNGEPYSEELLAELEKVGVEYTDYPFPRERGQRVVVEVDAAATLKVLSLERSGAADNGDLAQRLRAMDEPKFRKGNKEGRAAALRDAIEVLWDTPGLRLRTGNLSADISAPENVDVSKLDVSASMSHAELDRTVSLVEGTLAAYTVHRHWRGRDGSIVVGPGDEGSVLLPAKNALRERLAEECGTARVPYV
jgi:predicted RNase H-like nuclease/post-segregation antitoxin (ccd killing protein)